MSKGARPPLKRPSIELRKAVGILQHELVNIGVTLILPRPMRLRLRGDEPEVFAMKPKQEQVQDGRVAANMANCKDWMFLDRLL